MDKNGQLLLVNLRRRGIKNVCKAWESDLRKGFAAENYLKQAKERIASVLKVDPGEVFFTSGGTESNNLAIVGEAIALAMRTATRW